MTSLRPVFPCLIDLHLRSTSVVTMVALFAAHPAVAGAQQRGMRNQTPTQQAIMVNGVWSAYVTQADVVQTVASGGGINAQVTVRGEMLGAPLMGLATAALAGTAGPAEVQLATLDLTRGTIIGTVKLPTAQIQEVSLPAANASNTAAGSFAVKFYPAAAQQEPPPAATLPSITTSPVVRQHMFRLDIDSVGSEFVMAVAPVIATALVAQATELAEKPATTELVTKRLTTGLVPTRPPPSPLVVTVRSGPTVQAVQQFAQWQRWFASGETRGGTLTFFAADLSPLLVERFSGLRVLSISSTSGVSTVTLGMTGVAVEKMP
jgi:hypothetical protein